MSGTVFGLARAFEVVSRPQSLKEGRNAPASLRFFVIRHGESLGQLDKSLYSNDAEIPLTDWGHLQSEEAGSFLQGLDIGLFEIYHSTCRRACETTDSLIKGVGQGNILKISSDIRINKQIFGLFSGLFDDVERQAAYPEDFRTYKNEVEQKGFFAARPPGGESLADVQGKTRDFIQTLVTGDMRQLRNIVIVTHGTPALCIENILTNRGEDWVLGKIDTVPNCSIRFIENTGNGFTAKTIGSGAKRPVFAPELTSISREVS